MNQLRMIHPIKRLLTLIPLAVLATLSPVDGARAQRAGYDELVARLAQANAVPEALVHRVIVRESRYQPGLVGRGGTIGLMQIKLATARGLGYTGSAEGLRDPDTNLTYAVKYLAGAYKAAGGSEGGAVANYARGYYHQAKRQNRSPYEAPGSAAFAMQTSPQGVYAGRRDFEMTADRHTVF